MPVPENVRTIESYAFNHCDNLVIDRLTTKDRGIGSHAFYNVTLKEVELSESFEPAQNNWASFFGAKVEKLSFEEGITRIPARSMADSTVLSEADIPDSVTVIEENAFAGCGDLVNVRIPDSVEQIGAYAFWNCDSLTDISMPDDIAVIGRNAFN